MFDETSMNFYFHEPFTTSNKQASLPVYRSSARRIVSAISALFTGFVIKALIPIFFAFASVILSLYPVQIITGISGLTLRISLAS